MNDNSGVLIIDVDGCQYRAKVIVPGKMALSGLDVETTDKVLDVVARLQAIRMEGE